MGWLTAAGSVGRIILPGLSSVATADVACATAGGLTIVCFILLAWYINWKKRME